MLTTTMHYLPRGNPKIHPDWQRMLQQIKIKSNMFEQRFRTTVPFSKTKCVQLMRFILLSIDPDQITDDDFVNYTELVAPMIDALKISFNPVHSNNIAHDVFIQPVHGKTVAEWHLNLYHNNPLGKWPMGMRPMNSTASAKTVFDEWMKFRALRCWYHDSLELTSDFDQFLIKYNFDTPTYSVFTLDIGLFLMQAIKYYQMLKTDTNAQSDPAILYDTAVNKYIREAFTYLYEDLRRIWIMNIMMRMLEYGMLDQVVEDNVLVNPMLMNESLTNQGLMALDLDMTRLQNNTIRIEDFLYTDWFGGYSIKDLILNEQEMMIPPLKTYAHLKFIHDYPLLKLVLLVNNKYNRHSSAKRIRQLITQAMIPYTHGSVLNNIIEFNSRSMASRMLAEIELLASVE